MNKYNELSENQIAVLEINEYLRTAKICDRPEFDIFGLALKTISVIFILNFLLSFFWEVLELPFYNTLFADFAVIAVSAVAGATIFVWLMIRFHKE